MVLGNRKGMVPEANMKVNSMDVNTVKTNKVIEFGGGRGVGVDSPDGLATGF